MMTRRYYSTYMSNAIIDEPLRKVFPRMKSIHPAYKNCRIVDKDTVDNRVSQGA